MESFTDRLERIMSLPVCGICGYPIAGEICQYCAEAGRNKEAEEARQRERDIRRLGGLKAYEDFTLERFDNRTAIELCAEYPAVNLYIWGPAGSGKTHLATAIARGYREAVIAKPTHIYRKCRGLKDGEDEQTTIDRIANMPYLVIDDLGADKSTEYSIATLYEIIDARDMNRKTGLIITSNLSLNMLADKLGDDRITSRIRGMSKVIKLSGADRRIK
jgi:DNA replication protein DnaC